MSYKSHIIGPNRIFDHLYDPIYTMSGARDINRTNIQSLMQSAPLHIYPIYNTMFTDLPKVSRNLILLQRNLLPYFAKRFDENKENTECVLGKDRPKYFFNPLTNIKTINLQIDLKATPRRKETPQEKIKTIACQTIYREQSAQTKPWFPEGVTDSSKNEIPEIVPLAELISTPKLPGIRETEIVERLRKRLEWERSLPPIQTIRDWDKRRVVLEAFEWEEWMAREQDIDNCQQLRLIIAEKLVENRKLSHKDMAQTRVETSMKTINNDKNLKLEKIRIEHQRSLRKLDMKHKNLTRKYRPVDIVAAYTDPASDLNGPQRRFGIHPRHKHFIVNETKYEARLQALQKIQTKPTDINRFINAKEEMHKPKERAKEVQQGFLEENRLQKFYESLKALRIRHKINQQIPECLHYIKAQVSVRIETPTGSIHDITDNDAEYQNAVYLQKLIKGCATQKRILQDQKRYMGLITEIQSTHELNTGSESSNFKIDDKTLKNQETIKRQQNQLKHLIQSELKVQDIIEAAEGSSISFILEYLEEELELLIEQRKQHAMYLLAEKECQKRKAHEDHQNELEETRCITLEEIYRKTLATEHDTATMYLENILLDGISNIADDDAREKIRTIAKSIDQDACRRPSGKTEIIDDRNVVSDLVNNFIFPETYRRRNRDEINRNQAKYLKAAHDVIYKDLDKMYKSINTGDTSSGTQITKNILNDLILDIFSESSVDELLDVKTFNSHTVAEHEANRCIEKIIGKIGKPSKMAKIKTSSEIICNTVISDLIKTVVPIKKCTCQTKSSVRSRRHHHGCTASSSTNSSSRYSDGATSSAGEIADEQLNEILNDINGKLWQYALENDEEKHGKQK